MSEFLHIWWALLPALLLFSLPIFLGYLLARSIYGHLEERCIECERKSEDIRGKLANAHRGFRELEAEVQQEING